MWRAAGGAEWPWIRTGSRAPAVTPPAAVSRPPGPHPSSASHRGCRLGRRRRGAWAIAWTGTWTLPRRRATAATNGARSSLTEVSDSPVNSALRGRKAPSGLPRVDIVSKTLNRPSRTVGASAAANGRDSASEHAKPRASQRHDPPRIHRSQAMPGARRRLRAPIAQATRRASCGRRLTPLVANVSARRHRARDRPAKSREATPQRLLGIRPPANDRTAGHATRRASRAPVTSSATEHGPSRSGRSTQGESGTPRMDTEHRRRSSKLRKPALANG